MPLTCLACRTVFSNNEMQRDHYHTEWHRYNLKRKVVELAPVSREEFELKRVTAELQSNKASSGGRGAKSTVPTAEYDPEKQQLRCTVCQKNFQSTQALNNHLQSKKHIESAKRYEAARQTSRSESRKSSESFDISRQLAAEINTSSDCIQLVSKPEKSPQEQIESKEEANVPMEDDDADEDWEWEGEDEDWEGEDEDWEVMDDDDSEESQVRLKMMTSFDPSVCVFCLDRKKHESMEECLRHMEENHSFFVPYPNLVADLGQLLCYLHYKVEVLLQCVLCSRRSRRFGEGGAVRRHMSDKGHTRMAHDSPEHFLEYVTFYNEPEDVEGEEGVMGDDPLGTKLEQLLASALEDDFSLVLPSGAVIGHRALLRYYKQKPRAPTERVDSRKGIEDSSRRYIGFRSNPQALHNSMVLSKNVPSIRELKVLQRFKNRQRERLQTKQNDMKTHSRDQNFWSMRY